MWLKTFPEFCQPWQQAHCNMEIFWKARVTKSLVIYSWCTIHAKQHCLLMEGRPSRSTLHWCSLNLKYLKHCASVNVLQRMTLFLAPFLKSPNFQRLKEMQRGGKINLSQRTTINSQFSSGELGVWDHTIIQIGLCLLTYVCNAVLQCGNGLNP